MTKITEYPNIVTVLNDTDLFDVSQDLGASLFESKRLPYSVLKDAFNLGISGTANYLPKFKDLTGSGLEESVIFEKVPLVGNHLIGIYTTNPQATLHVEGSSLFKNGSAGFTPTLGHFNWEASGNITQRFIVANDLQEVQMLLHYSGVNAASGFRLGGGSNPNGLRIMAGTSGTSDSDTAILINGSKQVNVGGTSIAAIHATSLFQVDSTTKGIMVPRMTTTQRNAILGPATSLLIFNTTTNQYEFYNGTMWTALGGGSDGNGIYDGSGTVPTTTVATLTDTINFTGGTGVGIGITPVQKLHVNGSGIIATDLRINNTTRTTTEFGVISGGGVFIKGQGTASNEMAVTDSTNSIKALLQSNGSLYLGEGLASGYILSLSVTHASPFIEWRNGATFKGFIGVNKSGNIAISGTAADDMFFRVESTNIHWSADSGASSQMRLMSSGNVAIGAVSPTSRLHILGSGATSGTSSLLVQNSALITSLKVLDDLSVFNNGSGSVDTNTAFGQSALIANTTGARNTAFGRNALAANTTANQNTAFGYAALQLTTGPGNTGIGENTLQANTSGARNTAIGNEAMFSNTTGGDCTAVGNSCLLNNTTGLRNYAFGNEALNNNTTGLDNIGIGNQTLYYLTTTALNNRNVGVGNAALGLLGNGAVVGNNNTGIGHSTATNITTGSNNTFLGAFIGATITSGGGNTIIGANVDWISASVSNHILIGDGLGNIRIMSDGSGNIGIATTTPGATLHVNGTVRVDGQTSGTATTGATALPALAQGFIIINLDGTAYKVPYYNT